MKQVRRHQSEGLYKVAVLLLADQRYDQAVECLEVAQLIDPTHGEVGRTLRALASRQ